MILQEVIPIQPNRVQPELLPELALTRDSFQVLLPDKTGQTLRRFQQ
jgi:hypothetical protein